MSVVKANTYLAASGSTTEEPSIPALDQRMAKAWVVYNGATNTIEAAYNTSSVVDGGTGDYNWYFTESFADVNYAAVGSAGEGNTTSNITFRTQATNNVRVLNIGASAYDDPHNSLIAFSS